jgi:Reverse transcriptase (RNA-dependent DNA polymerase)
MQHVRKPDVISLLTSKDFTIDPSPLGHRISQPERDGAKSSLTLSIFSGGKINVRHDRLLAKVAQRLDDADVMHLLKVMLKASGKKGVPQGGVISPLLSNLYLNEVDKMLERAREVTRNGKYTCIEYDLDQLMIFSS